MSLEKCFTCVRYLGDRPCGSGLPESCADYLKIETTVLIIKLGAAGDVMRTTPLLYALSRSLHSSAGATRVLWYTEPDMLRVLPAEGNVDGNLFIRYLTSLEELYAYSNVDWIFNLDKSTKALGIARIARRQLAPKSFLGFMSDNGALSFGKDQIATEQAIRLGIDDDFKFKRNQETYQEMMLRMCGFEFNGWDYIANPAIKPHEPQGYVAFNVTAGFRFSGKIWPIAHWQELGKLVKTRLKKEIRIIGCNHEYFGTVQKNRNTETMTAFLPNEMRLTHAGDFEEFANHIAGADLLVTGDTLGLHVAIAAGTPTIALFGGTAAVEIEGYGIVDKMQASASCSPCYRKQGDCDRKPPYLCMTNISPKEVFERIALKLPTPEYCRACEHDRNCKRQIERYDCSPISQITSCVCRKTKEL